MSEQALLSADGQKSSGEGAFALKVIPLVHLASAEVQKAEQPSVKPVG